MGMETMTTPTVVQTRTLRPVECPSRPLHEPWLKWSGVIAAEQIQQNSRRHWPHFMLLHPLFFSIQHPQKGQGLATGGELRLPPRVQESKLVSEEGSLTQISP